MGRSMTNSNGAVLSTLDYHVLLAMAEGPQYGYAIKSAVEEESAGTLTPRAASLYRVIGRLMGQGFVEELAAPPVDAPHPGRTLCGRTRIYRPGWAGSSFAPLPPS